MILHAELNNGQRVFTHVSSVLIEQDEDATLKFHRPDINYTGTEKDYKTLDIMTDAGVNLWGVSK